MKKVLVLFSILALSLVLFACQDKDERTKVSDVESVEFLMDSYTVSPGTHSLKTKSLPEGSIQDVKFEIIGTHAGIGIDNKKKELTIGLNVENGLKFTIVAISTYDLTKSARKEFTVVNESAEAIQITTEEELFAIAENHENFSKSYKLTNDIVLTKEWNPIGVADLELDNGKIELGVYFTGVFDGQGYEISGIEVNGVSNAGFFAQIGASGIVKNTKFSGTVNAKNWSGAIAGINSGTISNVISNVSVTVEEASAGALVSVNRGTIEYSYAIGKVLSVLNDSSKGKSSGLVAANEGVLTEAYGDYEKMESRNYAAWAPTTNPKYMLSTLDMQLEITWSKFDTDVWYIKNGTYPLLKNNDFVPPVIEDKTLVVIKNEDLNIDVTELENFKIEVEVINGNGAEELTFEISNNIQGVVIDSEGNVSFDKDVIDSEFTFTVIVTISGTEIKTQKEFEAVYSPIFTEDVIRIKNAEEFNKYLNGQKNEINLSKTFILEADIELTKEFKGIGIAPNEDEGIAGVPFTGVFDGNGHKLSGINIAGAGFNKGIFAYIGETGIVKNTHFVGNVEATSWSGGLVHTNKGTIKDVIVEIKLYVYNGKGGVLAMSNLGTIENVIVIGSAATDAGEVGLIVTSEGTLVNVYVDGTVFGTDNLLAHSVTKDVEGKYFKTTEQMKSVDLYNNFSSDIWNIVDGEYPTLIIK